MGFPCGSALKESIWFHPWVETIIYQSDTTERLLLYVIT